MSGGGSGSRFGKLLQAAREPEADPEHKGDSGSGGGGDTDPAPAAVAAVPLPAPARSPGRPPGKRSDPAYTQITAYVPKRLHRRVKLALLEDGTEGEEDRDFSDLVEELLDGWLKGRKSG